MINIFQTLTNLLLSKTARNTYIVFFGNGLSAFFAFIFTVIYTNKLSWNDIGYFSALLALFLLVSDLSDIGIGSSLSAFLPPLEKTKDKLAKFLKTALLLQFFIAITITATLYLFSYKLSDLLFHTREHNFLIKITIIGIFFMILANFFQYSLSARQKFYQVGFLSAFGGIIRLMLMIMIVILSAVNLSNTVYVQTLSTIILMIVALFLLKLGFLKKKFDWTDLKKLLKFTYLLGIARGLTAIASRIDVLMLISLRNPTEAGIYATASRVIAIYPLLAGSFSTVIAPKLSASSDRKILAEFLFKITLATLGLIGTILFMIIIARPFMVILFPEKGTAAVSVFQLLLISMIFFVASIPAVSLAIYYLRKPQILTINSVLQLIIVIIGNLIFIPRYGRFGATYSLILAYGITLLLTSYLSYHFYRKKHA